jgi:hypothetical protein
LKEIFDEWMANHVGHECTQRTAEAYQEQGDYVLRRIGGTRLKDIGRNLMEDTIRAIADHGGVPRARSILRGDRSGAKSFATRDSS